jgi:hypothetical protein
MPVGDKEAAVVRCVNGQLQRKGYNPPYDTTQKMGGVPVYGYQYGTMIIFHRQVKLCLARNGYSYVYSETNTYIEQTLAMSLADIYAAISVKTTAVAPAVAGPAEAAPAEAEAGHAAPKRAKKKAAKHGRKAAKVRPAKKKAAKKKKGANRKAAPAKRAATGRVQKRKADKRRQS